MTMTDLKIAASECLAKAFNGDTTIPVHVVQAATAVLLSDKPRD